MNRGNYWEVGESSVVESEAATTSQDDYYAMEYMPPNTAGAHFLVLLLPVNS